MASTSNTPLSLTEQLKEAGFSLLHSPSSVEELLPLLDKAEDLLFDVDQAPPASVKDALLPMMKALKSDTMLKHSEAIVRVSVASCIHEIARITAPLEPYDDEIMKEIFKLTVSSFEKLSQPSTRCYEKAASIIYTIARVRSCVVMLDLECDGLVVEMFHRFLKTTGSNHTDDVLWAMERIMTMVLEESENISMDLLEPLLASVRKENENVAPISWKLGENVLSNCAEKLRPILKDAVQSASIVLDQYAPVIATICGSSSDNTEHLLANGSQEQGRGEALAVTSTEVGAKSGLDGAPVPGTKSMSAEEDSSSKMKSFNLLDADGPIELASLSEVPRKRDRRPNSLMNPEEGYEHFWGLQDGKCHHITPHESPKPPTSEEGRKRRFSRKKGNAVGSSVALPETASDEEGELLVSAEQRRPSEPLYREVPSSSNGRGSKKKKSGATSDKEKPAFSGKKVDLSACTSSTKDGCSSEKATGRGLKRKRAPRKEEKFHQQDVGEEVVGQKIKVWWPQDRVFYDGVVRSYDRKRKRHQVVYTDGVEERLNLKKQWWKLIENDDLPDEDSANPEHNKQPELLHTWKKRRRLKLTEDSSPYRLVKRAEASSSLMKTEPSAGLNEDEAVLVDDNLCDMR
ncbi:uncharacterized protein LOC116210200 isoform X2 [Punica granatum]|uniref:Uncharacterized protein LOC116210200 isoform X2 n=1 Tax=Punica granatum TaxID=22663 RepID=A0A6P8E387_PUNGR|nr:uncharacterized protein LOC116210200 isoform X2 [Punica granatum]